MPSRRDDGATCAHRAARAPPPHPAVVTGRSWLTGRQRQRARRPPREQAAPDEEPSRARYPCTPPPRTRRPRPRRTAPAPVNPTPRAPAPRSVARRASCARAPAAAPRRAARGARTVRSGKARLVSRSRGSAARPGSRPPARPWCRRCRPAGRARRPAARCARRRAGPRGEGVHPRDELGDRHRRDPVLAVLEERLDRRRDLGDRPLEHVAVAPLGEVEVLLRPGQRELLAGDRLVQHEPGVVETAVP